MTSDIVCLATPPASDGLRSPVAPGLNFYEQPMAANPQYRPARASEPLMYVEAGTKHGTSTSSGMSLSRAKTATKMNGKNSKTGVDNASYPGREKRTSQIDGVADDAFV
eukprot:m.43173 g.43173  ORF g.43173 m.43173 type:complete len:109 (-) comp15046_c0_seq3:30-356(-)